MPCVTNKNHCEIRDICAMVEQSIVLLFVQCVQFEALFAKLPLCILDYHYFKFSVFSLALDLDQTVPYVTVLCLHISL